jgi:uncharacterized coiled-coil protein SlyX
MSNRTRELEQ